MLGPFLYSYLLCNVLKAMERFIDAGLIKTGGKAPILCPEHIWKIFLNHFSDWLLDSELRLLGGIGIVQRPVLNVLYERRDRYVD